MNVRHFRNLILQVAALHAIPADEILEITRWTRALQFSNLLDAIRAEWGGDTRYHTARTQTEEMMR